MARSCPERTVPDDRNSHDDERSRSHGGDVLPRAVPGPIEVTRVSEAGIVDLPSARAFDETVDRLQKLLQSKGVTLFALIDHSGEAKRAGIEMPPTKLLIFGNPKAGTALMLAAPRSAIDLPLKILIWQDAQGKVWVSYDSPAYLQARHQFPKELLQNIAAVETLARAAAE